MPSDVSSFVCNNAQCQAASHNKTALRTALSDAPNIFELGQNFIKTVLLRIFCVHITKLFCWGKVFHKLPQINVGFRGSRIEADLFKVYRVCVSTCDAKLEGDKTFFKDQRGTAPLGERNKL